MEKLKREYGVKVVATRERPGANLVINCDDYSGQEGSSICKRNTGNSGSAYHPVARYVYVPSTSDQPTSGDDATLAGEPHYLPPSEHQPEEVAQPEEQPEYRREIVYSNRGGDQQEVGYHQPEEQPARERSAYLHNQEESNGCEESGHKEEPTTQHENYKNSNVRQYLHLQEQDEPSSASQDQSSEQGSAGRQAYTAAAAGSEGERLFSATFEEQPKEAVNESETQPEASTK